MTTKRHTGEDLNAFLSGVAERNPAPLLLDNLSGHKTHARTLFARV
jgi:hypothetical protein